jgi:hypothetical protein
MSFLLNISVTLVLSVWCQLFPLTCTHSVQGVSKTFGQTSGVTSPTRKYGKPFYKCMSAEIVRGTDSNMFILILHIFVCSDTYRPYFTQLQSKVTRAFTK